MLRQSYYPIKRKRVDCKMEFEDTSLENPVEHGDWRPIVENKIKHSDSVIVMIGKDTSTRKAVDYEIRTAHKHGVPVIPVRIHKDKNHKLPKPIVQYGYSVINWKTEDIQHKINDIR